MRDDEFVKFERRWKFEDDGKDGKERYGNGRGIVAEKMIFENEKKFHRWPETLINSVT